MFYTLIQNQGPSGEKKTTDQELSIRQLENGRAMLRLDFDLFSIMDTLLVFKTAFKNADSLRRYF